MPVIFLCFIIFALWLRVKLNRNGSTGNSDNEAFWQREKNANFARCCDISTLDYFTPAESDLPFSDIISDEREADLQAEVKRCMSRRLLNLSAYSNTDLKEKYGIANLEILSEYDQNYLVFIRSLSRWGSYLYEKKDTARAKQIMEYSLALKSDISAVYTTLGQIYAAEGDTEKLDSLIAAVEESDFPLKQSILKQLTACKVQ